MKSLKLCSFSTFVVVILVTSIDLSECQEDCEDQKWCSTFTAYCDKIDLVEKMRRLCPIACSYCQDTANKVALSPWGEWSECTSKCGFGIQTRTRSCNATECSKDDLGLEEARKCYALCNSWGDWSPWSNCSSTCDSGIQKRVRSCNGRSCMGKGEEQRACYNQGCAMWSRWSGWSPCSRTCGGGRKLRSRLCLNGTPEMDCRGPERQEVPCNTLPACSSAIQLCNDSQPWCERYGQRWCASWDFSTQCRKLCGGC